jgi:cardiolipin synthase A/B
MATRSAIRVAVPVKLARLKVWVDKGRHWSAVDKLILWSLAQKPRSAAELADEAGIPTRLVIEIILRMMRFGWIEFAAEPSGASFRATEAGREVIETFETLPPMTRRSSRRISFVMEPVTLHAFGLRDLKPYRPAEIDMIERDHDVRRIVAEGDWRQLSSLDLYSAVDEVLPDDEQLSTIDYGSSETFDQFALFTVLGDAIKGLPPNPPGQLVRAIKQAAKQRPGNVVTVRTVKPAPVAATRGELRCEPIRPDDIILSGPEHQDLLVQILRQARSTFVMHTTFLREVAFAKLQDEFRRAAKRGVAIDIFWGADGEEKSRKNNLEAAIAVNLRIGNDPDLRGRGRVHLHSTRSHAKLVIADAAGRSASEFVAVIGSCNWLYSGFNRVETSVVVRQPHAVAMVAEEIAELVFDVAKSSTISADLTAIARTLRTHAAPIGPAMIRVVKGDDHSALMRLARETAVRAIMVGGDRLGLAAEARTMIPMMAAAQRSVEGTICYSKPSGPVTAGDARELQKVAASANVRLLQIEHRELHGKFLLWDDDHLVVTSLNWSSADTRSNAPQAEIGLYICSPGVAENVRRRLQEGWPALASDDEC